jgi:hypothetical protein
MAMDSKSLVVGSPFGLIKMFNRNDLGRDKVFWRRRSLNEDSAKFLTSIGIITGP